MAAAYIERPSKRLVDQRLRNRMIDAVEFLALGDDAVRSVGPAEYFEAVYDVISHRDDGGMYPNGALTDAERAALREVGAMLDDACDATPAQMIADELIASGWPRRIQPLATNALAIMRARGRFSDEREEDAPTA